MTGNMALKAGKGALHKFSGKRSGQDPTIRSVDHAHYRGAKVEKRKENGQLVFSLNDRNIANDHRKDSAYYEYKGVPEKDAKILSSVVRSARFLDNGFRIPYVCHIGVSTFIELIPELGDFIGTGLSIVFVVLPALRVSKGLGNDKKKLRNVMVVNVAKGCCIGLVPFVGDWIDTMKKYNVQNADALEAMLLKRVDEAAKLGRDTEKVGRTNGHQYANTNGHYLAATDRDHDSEPPPHPPRKFITANNLPQGPKAGATQPKKNGGNFFRRREELQGGQEVGTTMEEVAPVRPPRPEHSMHGHGGRF